MDQFSHQIQGASTDPLHDVPMLMRSSQRITITIPWATHQQLLQRSWHEGRSVSNLAAHLLEVGLT